MYRVIMNRIVNEIGYYGGQFLWPDGIVSTTVCHKSGKLPDENNICTGDPTGKGEYTEYFEAGTVPTDYCDVHEVAYVCSETGQLATEYCPGYYRTCIIRPDDIKGGPARGYTLDSNYAYPYSYCSYHTGYIFDDDEELYEDDELYEDEMYEEYYEEDW